MMLGIPNNNNNSAEAAVAALSDAAAHDSGGGDSGEVGGGRGGAIPGSGGRFSEDDKSRIDESERGAGGNRWPRQETLALLKIRSEMDVAFRDSSLKGPLWEEVSRKMAELGYHRTSKKCKEKFENVFKYHKRTREGRASKADGKTYRFFDQLEALETNPSALQLPPTPTQRPPPLAAATAAGGGGVVQMPPAVSNPPNNISSSHTVSSAPLSPNPVSFAQNLVTQNVANPNIPTLPSLQPPPSTTNAMNIPPPLQTAHHHHFPPSHANIMAGMLSNSSSSSTSSDEEIERRHGGRKRKWKDFFERLMKDVIVKQEELQKKFLESLEKRERDRMIREEAWRVQEMARMNREHDLLVQERSMAAAKDAAVISFLQKITDQQNNSNGTPNAIQIPLQLQIPNVPSLSSPPPPPSSAASLQAPPAQTVAAPPPPISIPAVPVAIPAAATPAPAPQAQAIQAPPPRNLEITPKTTSTTDNGIQNFGQPSSSRWPKSEVQALIRLRTNLDVKYQENGPKGPLWEEISAGMRKLGYNRNAKRCKEKWENINKYFKKVKESNKKRPEDSKTCPYFHQLDALYKEKAKIDTSTYNFSGAAGTNVGGAVKPENSAMAPIMARPEQQWPLHQHQENQNQQQQQQQHDSAMEDADSENMDENDHDEDVDDEDEEDEGGGYEIVTNKQPSTVATTVE